jgi:hypothetical protein
MTTAMGQTDPLQEKVRDMQESIIVIRTKVPLTLQKMLRKDYKNTVKNMVETAILHCIR